MNTPPLRLVLYTGSDTRRDLADLSISAAFNDDAKLEVDLVHKTIREVTAGRRYSDLEGLALGLAHKLLDSQSSVTEVRIEVSASSWRRLGTQGFERGSGEVRVANAAVGRDGSATVGAAIRGLKLMMGQPMFETVDLEWKYKTAGVSYNSSWSAVRKMVLQAFDDREEPQAIAQLLVDVIEILAEVKLTIETEALEETGTEGLYEAEGTSKRRSAFAKAR
jgi:urate oxidase